MINLWNWFFFFYKPHKTFSKTMTHRIFFFFMNYYISNNVQVNTIWKFHSFPHLLHYIIIFKKCSYLSITQFTVVSVRVWDTGRQTTELPHFLSPIVYAKYDNKTTPSFIIIHQGKPSKRKLNDVRHRRHLRHQHCSKPSAFCQMH